ncbi:MAG: hypothetical protein DRJ35_06650 [Thermoprotei archaeon]|nr:MAG: hypothetical protein DRJ35_06650 [Thermoprotei archaeon]
MKRKGKLVQWIVFAVSVLIYCSVLFFLPDRAECVVDASMRSLVEMALILPAVMILLGLFAVWVPKDLIVKYLGRSSGIKGIALSLVLGALPTGPLYIAFPISATLLRKGARVSNVIIFLTAWSCIKLPQEMVELQFLGLKFMSLRLFLTIIFSVIMGFSIECVIRKIDARRGEISS